MTVGSNTLRFTYDANGQPLSVTYNGTDYYYVTNIQGDVIGILDSTGNTVVTYTYNAWGNHVSTTGSMASTLGTHNPLRYRGYVYDSETELYYLQSRYYNPEVGRFINADAFTATGQGILGNNMFAYCLNNPINGLDPCGTCFHHWRIWEDCEECKKEEENGGRPSLTVVFTNGYFASLNIGLYQFTGSVELAFDLKGNLQLVGTVAVDISSAGELSVAGGRSASAFIMPDTSYLSGETTYLGGSMAAPIPYTPIAIGGGVNVGQTSDGYWGVATTCGISPASPTATMELHGGISYTFLLTDQLNIIELVKG